MDYLTFTTIHTMIILSWCGIVYLAKHVITFIRWFVKFVLKEIKEEDTEK